MKPQAASLEQIQRWMQSVIMHPGGVTAGLTSSEAREHLDVAPAELESVIAPSAALDSATRLEIYVDAYFERLLECLREEFTATRYAVGDELFDALAFGYLQQYPSRSYTLNLLGARLPEFLAESRLHERDMPPEARPDWPDFVIDLARFERTLRDVFDGQGTEGLAPLSFEQLASVPAERWGTMRLQMASGLRLQQTGYPLNEYWTTLRDGGQPEPPTTKDCYLAIHRRDYLVERHELTAAAFELLSALAEGETLESALGRAARQSGGNESQLHAEVGNWFAEWTALGFFLACDPADEPI